MNYTLITYLAGICIIFVFGRLLIVPLKFVFKFLANSLVGAVVLGVINFIGNFFSFHIGLNIFTILFVSLLGIPGVTLLSLVNVLI
mgnify:CR=1 FL=1